MKYSISITIEIYTTHIWEVEAQLLQDLHLFLAEQVGERGLVASIDIFIVKNVILVILLAENKDKKNQQLYFEHVQQVRSLLVSLPHRLLLQGGLIFLIRGYYLPLNNLPPNREIGILIVVK